MRPRRRIIRRRPVRPVAKRKGGFRFRKTGAVGTRSSVIIKNPSWRGFPDRYFTPLVTQSSVVFSPGFSNTFNSWKGHSVLNVGPSQSGGAYNASFPSALTYFLRSNQGNYTSGAPYTDFRVWGSKIEVRYTPTQFVTTIQPTTGAPANFQQAELQSMVRLILYPAQYGSNVTDQLNNALTHSEQPYVKIMDVPATTTSSTRVMRHNMSLRKILGYKYKSTVESLTPGNYNVDPGGLWYWNFLIFADGTGSYAGVINVKLTHYCEFFTRNTFSSATPT